MKTFFTTQQPHSNTLLSNSFGPSLTFFLFALFCFSSQLLHAQITWNGSVNSDWYTPENWTPNEVPGAADPVRIPDAPNGIVITAGQSIIVKSVNIFANGALTINTQASLRIQNASNDCLTNNGTIKNSGMLIIQGTTGLDANGIINHKNLFNYTSGNIFINGCTGMGMYNHFGIVHNDGIITIGDFLPVGALGIYNENGTIANGATGVIKLDRSSIMALHNDGGVFDNSGKLRLGGNTSAGTHGIVNRNIFNNNAGAEIKIDRVTEYGMYNYGTFTNTAKVIIGEIESATTLGGVVNFNALKNEPGAEIAIGCGTEIAFSNYYGETSNKGKIIVGAFTFPFCASNIGLRNGSANFINHAQGEIFIDKIQTDALLVADGEFTNFGKVTIGSKNLQIGMNGIHNLASFVNEPSGEISIDRCGTNGFLNEAIATLQGSMAIGALAPVGQYSIRNESVFSIAACSKVDVFAPLFNNYEFILFGLLTVNTTGAHSNSSFSNAGTINYVRGNPIPNVLNLSVIVMPITSDCNEISNVLEIGNLNSFSIGTQWYKDAALTQPVGTYNQATNTFSATETASNLYFEILDVYSGCTQSLKVKSNYGDMLPPVVVCKNATIPINTAGTAPVLLSDILQSAVDNCGGPVSVVSIAPAEFSCNQIGSNTVALLVRDNVNNFATCTATITVVDNLKPIMVCKPVTIALNAAGLATLSKEQVNNGSYDNCSLSSITLSQTNFTCSHIGQNNVELGGIDQSGNKGMCIALVTVVDPIKPTVACKNAIVNLDANGSVAVPTNLINNGASDNCSFSLSLLPQTFNCANVGQNTIVLKATDTGGNTATCAATVTVKDVTAPTAHCKNVSIFLDDLGNATLSPFQINNGSSDACGIATMTISKTQFNCSEIPGGAQVVTLTIKDVNNNVSSCLAQVTPKDNLAPTAICENTTVTLGSNGKATVYPTELAIESFDNCSVWSYSPVAKVYTTANIGNNNLAITVKDYSGNVATCVSVVTVKPYGSNFNGNNGGDKASTPTDAGSFKLFPNPSQGASSIAFELPSDQAFTVRVMDMAGRLIQSHQSQGIEGKNVFPIDLAGVPAGLYMIDFQSDSLKKQTQLVIQR